MIISGANNAAYDIYSVRNRKSPKPANDTNEKHSKVNGNRDIVSQSNVVSFSEFESTRSTGAFKEHLGYQANQALKQYSDYRDLEEKEKIGHTLGINVYA